ncbi:unnamed protein product [Eruca vesicaria subsp. sativa]|uniref:CCT domain-containing protein n=1 Tax=Eruca vesicaria subsp. sativa TaxID=29727 RepID=A0ABC8LT28_ERUVS|nr:unnamed protein product [Eruca vesicaria subsp. sativa]
MSSEDSMTLVLKCMLRGAADYLIKPMRKNELKNLWQHVWRRLAVRDGYISHGLSLPASQQNLEENDETSADSRYHSDHGSGAQATSYNGHSKLIMTDVKDSDKKLESIDVTMDLIGGIDKRPECFYGDNTRGEYVGPELGLSLKRSCSGSFEKQDKTKQQKLSLSDESAFSRYENSQPAEKAEVAVEPSSSGEPKTPSESHEKLRRVTSDHGSATTSSNQEHIGSSSLSFHNQVTKQTQDSLFPVDSNSLKASKELGSESTNEWVAGQRVKEGEEGGLSVEQRRSQREAALLKFRLKRKDRCFGKKVRYQSRKKLAEQRPRVKGQFVRAVNSDASK